MDTTQPEGEGQPRLQAPRILLEIPRTLDFGAGPFPELALPEIAQRHARHHFMIAVFIYAP